MLTICKEAMSKTIKNYTPQAPRDGGVPLKTLLDEQGWNSEQWSQTA
jgi:hypothetical protein